MEMTGTKFWLGRLECPEGIIDLHCRDLNMLIAHLSVADLLVTVDTGPAHIAAALGIPMIVMSQSSDPDLHFTDQMDYQTVKPDLDCLNCQGNVCPLKHAMPPCQEIPPKRIASAVNHRLRDVGASCLIPTFRAPYERLRRCVDCVYEQVDEVVITVASDGEIPRMMSFPPKVRFVKCPRSNIGFGKNVNFGMRHTNGRYVLILNDDVFLAADAVSKMMDQMKAGVGVVGHLLFYPDGTIQHAGKLRAPHGRGWGHIDHHSQNRTWKEPREVENTVGASFMVRRKAFYDAGGFDEDFFLYVEDDAFMLQVRKAGWKIMYTPHASGVHEESQTTRHLSGVQDIMRQSSRTFESKWGKYLNHNATNLMGTFDYK
jgi:GT2 family glycosyltransferase